MSVAARSGARPTGDSPGLRLVLPADGADSWLVVVPIRADRPGTRTSAGRAASIMLIGPLYHWSPRDRLKSIQRYGLVPGNRPTIGTVPAVHDGVQVICLSTDPWLAWRLSGDCSWARPVYEWDLWQTELLDTDVIYGRCEFGRLLEVRVANRIRKSRLRWLAERRSGRPSA